MHEQPRQPRHETGELKRPRLRHRRRTPDGRHRALVEIRESRARGDPGRSEFILDDLRGVLRHLHRGGGNAGHGLAVFLEQRNHVAKGEDLGMTGDATIGIHFHAARAVEFHAELFCQWRRGHARRPEDVRGANGFAGVQFHARRRDVRDLGVRANLHAQFLQLLGGGNLQRIGHVREHARRSLDQNDVRQRGIDVAEVLAQHLARKFRKGSGQFHAGRPAAHDHDGHQARPLGGVALVLRALEGEQHLPADADGVLQ